jgi:small subunit ribosomal protein S6
MREYELMCVLDPELDESTQEQQTERLRTLISNRRGEIVNVEPWGRRRLAYPIGAFRDGYYVVTRFKMPPEESGTLERNLGLNESIIRHLVVRLDSD